MPSMSRREVIALPVGVAALHAQPVPTHARPDPVSDADRELLGLCQRYLSLERRLFRLDVALVSATSAGGGDLEDRLFATVQRFLPYQRSLLGEVMDLRANTPTGLRAKAGVLATTIEYQADDTPVWSHLAVWSVCRDLLGRDPVDGGTEDVQ